MTNLTTADPELDLERQNLKARIAAALSGDSSTSETTELPALLLEAYDELPDPDFIPDEEREVRVRALRQRILKAVMPFAPVRANSLSVGRRANTDPVAGREKLQGEPAPPEHTQPGSFGGIEQPSVEETSETLRQGIDRVRAELRAKNGKGDS